MKRVAAVAVIALLAACGGGGKPPPKTSSTDDAFEAAVAAEKERDAKAAAAAAPAAAEARPQRESKGAVFPAPFSGEEIRAATKSGRTYRYRVEVRGKPAKERVLTFVKVDADGCEIFAGGESPKRKGWPSLQKDSEFPKERVQAREETVKLPGGKFDCMVYEVSGNDGEVTTYYFAKTLPGAPVLFYTDVDGKRMKTTTLLQHLQGKD
ncbi:MAG TPA: hypothetical protein VLT33_05805 [Labilithrix sp.]|nr:hypothetical protein [Labilithrix sp.]